jgi:hypothetical protein
MTQPGGPFRQGLRMLEGEALMGHVIPVLRDCAASIILKTLCRSSIVTTIIYSK